MSQYFKTKYNDLEDKWKSIKVKEKGREKEEEREIRDVRGSEVPKQQYLLSLPQPSPHSVYKQKPIKQVED